MITVAIIDTDTALAQEMKAYLEQEGTVHAEIFGSAVDVLDTLKQVSFDVIVSEYFLPVTSGLTFLEVIRRGRGDRDTPFIFFAGPMRDHMIIEALNVGATYVILKRDNPSRYFPAIRHFVLDAAEQKRTKLALRESEERYRNVVEDMTEFILRFGPDGMVRFVNDAYLRYFSARSEDLVGKPVATVCVCPEIGCGPQLEGLNAESPVFITDIACTDRSGRTAWLRWNVRALFDGQGRIREYQAVGRDITEQKQTEEALRQANQTLTLMNTITRHDVLNQLTVLSSYLELAREDTGPGRVADYIEKAQNAAATMRLQILFTRDFQQIGSQAPQWQNVADTVRKAILHLAVEGVRVQVDIGDDLWVFADPLLEKVFYNLFDNSLRHGERVTEITVSTEERDGEVRILYRDNGVGVPEKVKESIFKREYFKNTGLGLYLIRQILAITDITIRETGAEGKGVQFEITIPRERFAKRAEGTGG